MISIELLSGRLERIIRSPSFNDQNTPGDRGIDGQEWMDCPDNQD